MVNVEENESGRIVRVLDVDPWLGDDLKSWALKAVNSIGTYGIYRDLWGSIVNINYSDLW